MSAVNKLKNKIKILLVEQNQFLRRNLTIFLNSRQDMKVCGEVDNAVITISMIEKVKPDIVIINIEKVYIIAFGLIKEIKKKHPDLPIIALSVNNSSKLTREMAKAGADGFMDSSRATNELIYKIIKLTAD